MKHKYLIFALLLLLLGLAVFLKSQPPAPVKPDIAKPGTLALAPADLARVTQGEFSVVEPLSGELSAILQTTLTAQVEGELAEVRGRSGMRVKAGEILARFNTRDLAQKVAVQEAQLAKSREQLAFQKQQLKRNQDLLAQNFISQNAYDSAASQLSVQEADLRGNEAQLALARQSQDYALIRAPFAGIVAERLVEPGQRVGFNSKLFSLVNLDTLELKLLVPVNRIGHVRAGQTVHFTVEGMTERFTGKVERIAPQADASRAFPVYVRVENRQHLLRAGMYARAELALAQKTSTLTLPATAVREESGQKVVYAIENQVLQRKVVITGSSAAGQTEIISGLNPDALVVAMPSSGLAAGRAVQLPARP